MAAINCKTRNISATQASLLLLLLFFYNINFIILHRYNYTNMGNFGNPYGLLQDSPVVYFFFYQVWTPYVAWSNYKSNYKLISIYKLAHH